METNRSRSILTSYFKAISWRPVINLLPFIFLFFFLLILQRPIVYNGPDDTYFSQAHTQFAFADFLTFRYTRWTGRLVAEAMAYSVLRQPIAIWRLLNALVITGLCFLLVYFLLGRRFWQRPVETVAFTTWGICLGIGLINIQVLQGGMFWPSGTMYYLWPLTACALAILPFFNRWIEVPRVKGLPSVLGAIFPVLGVLYAGMGNEQVALMLFSLMLAINLALWRYKKTFDPYLLALTAFSMICVVILFTAPGNYIRYQSEVTSWYPTFPQIGIELKTFLGLAWSLDKVVNLNRVMVVLLFALLAVNLWQNRRNRFDAILTGFATFVTAFLLISLVNFDNQPRNFQLWLNDRLFNFELLAKYVQGEALPKRIAPWQIALIPYVIWLSILAVLPALFVRSSKNEHLNGWIYAGLFFLGLSTLMVMSFSPTIYASGNRTVFPFSVLLLFILGALYEEAKDRIPRPVVLAVYLFSILSLITNSLVS